MEFVDRELPCRDCGRVFVWTAGEQHFFHEKELTNIPVRCSGCRSARKARMGLQDDVKCCYAHQTKIWVTDPDQTMWEVYVLHDDVPDWGEKDRKLKLLTPPFQALGVWGTIRRAWSNTFRKRATKADGAAALAEHANSETHP